jgi:hypothetical protein
MCLVHGMKSAHPVIQSYKQHHEFVVVHSYIQEQLVFAAPCERVYLCLAHRIDCLPFYVVGLCYLPPPAPWLGMAPGLGLPWFLLSTCPLRLFLINHTYKFSYNYHMKPKSYDTYLTLQTHDALHMHIYELGFFFFFLPVIRQVSWPRPLMLGTVIIYICTDT